MARRQATIFINGKEVKNELASIAKEKRKLYNELRNLTIGTEEYAATAKELRRVNDVYDEQIKKLRATNSAYDKLRGSLKGLVGLAAASFTVDAIIDYGKQLFNLGAQMEVLTNKAKTVFAETLPQVTAAAEENAAAMGLTTAQYINAAAAIQDLLIPMGFQRQEAADISLALTDLSGALSEWTGGQIQSADVSKILSKALLGEREELKQLGIAIQEADVQARLAEKGLDKLTGTLLQQAKATATLELITEKSVDAQTAYAQNADTLVRRQAELSAKFSEVTEKLATALVPVFERLLTVVEAVANGLLAFSDLLGNSTAETDKATKAVSKLQIQFNDEIETLQRGNLSTDNRRKLIDQINKKYKDYLPNLIKETDTLGELKRAQEEANRAFNQKIILLAAEAQLTDVARKRVEAQAEELKLQKELTRRERELAAARENSRAGQSVSGIDYRVNDQEEFLRRTKRAIEENQKLQQELRGEFEITQQAAKELGLDIESILGGPGGSGTPTVIRPNEDDIKKTEENYKKLLEIIAKYQEEARILKLDEDQQGVERIKQKYQKEIDLALELEKKGVEEAAAQRFELIRLRDEEIARYELEQSDKRLEEELARAHEHAQQLTDAELEEIIKRDEAEATLKAELNEILLEEQELELLRLRDYYAELRQLAIDNKLDTEETLNRIEEAYQKERDEIRDKYSKEEIKRKDNELEAKLRIAEAEVSSYRAVSDALSGLVEQHTVLGKALLAFEKGVAIAEVIVSLQRELASIAAANASLGPLAPAVIAAQTTAAKIRAGLRIATIGATTIQAIAQKKEGGYLDVKGPDDGRQYRARYIGDPQTGMLPPHPVVLASEAGPEYFVSNKDLRNPKVLDYVRAIENIRLNRIGQFQEGGFNPPAAVPAAPAGPDPATMALMQTIERLNAILDGGLAAMIPDDTIVSLERRKRKMQQAAGGPL